MNHVLPFVDEHQVVVNAPVQRVWDALESQFAGIAKSPFAAYARAISADPGSASGRPLDPGATVPGFEVICSVPPERIELAGRHRFSRYRLVFHLAPQDGKTLLRAQTYAVFPGVLGAAYEGLVIKSGAHRVMTRRLLAGVRRRAEANAT